MIDYMSSHWFPSMIWKIVSIKGLLGANPKQKPIDFRLKQRHSG